MWVNDVVFTFLIAFILFLRLVVQKLVVRGAADRCNYQITWSHKILKTPRTIPTPQNKGEPTMVSLTPRNSSKLH